MPLYEWKCNNCGTIHEIFMKINPQDSLPCPVCGNPMHILISNTTFILHGTGWYATDYGNKKSDISAHKKDDNGKGTIEKRDNKASKREETINTSPE